MTSSDTEFAGNRKQGKNSTLVSSRNLKCAKIQMPPGFWSWLALWAVCKLGHNVLNQCEDYRSSIFKNMRRTSRFGGLRNVAVFSETQTPHRGLVDKPFGPMTNS
jgi:hypothetical protein